MSGLAFLRGERVRESKDLGSDEVVIAHTDRRPRTAALRETLYRHAIGTHWLDRDRTARTAALDEATCVIIERTTRRHPETTPSRARPACTRRTTLHRAASLMPPGPPPSITRQPSKPRHTRPSTPFKREAQQRLGVWADRMTSAEVSDQ